MRTANHRSVLRVKQQKSTRSFVALESSPAVIQAAALPVDLLPTLGGKKKSTTELLFFAVLTLSFAVEQRFIAAD